MSGQKISQAENWPRAAETSVSAESARAARSAVRVLIETEKSKEREQEIRSLAERLEGRSNPVRRTEEK
jgi:hypothetical protein